MAIASVDLNSDIGESFGRWRLGDDAAMLGIVSSANIACGFHAGDPAGILETLRIAADRGVAVGAHIAYRDLAGFGRRDLDASSEELVPDLMYQIAALRGLAESVGTRVSYVKPHGALYNRIVHDERQARDVVAAVQRIDPGLVLLGLPGSVVLRIAAGEGLAVRHEVFADRGYNADGTLVSRRLPGAVLHDPAEVAARMVSVAKEGRLEAADGTTVELEADSICVHGDSPGAIEMAQAVRAALEAEGITVAPFATAPATAS